MGAKVIAVVGSINFDLTTFVPGFPAVNQTLLANGALTSIGGKGANQAVAAARAGSQVSYDWAIGVVTISAAPPNPICCKTTLMSQA